MSNQHDDWYPMPPDTNAWEPYIIQLLSRKVPEIPRYISGIAIEKMDPIVGDADGTIDLLANLAAIPLTIRKGKLAPLDVMVTVNGDFYPVNENFLQKVYADNVIARPVVDRPAADQFGQDGPAKRIEHIDTIKKASYEKKVQLKEALEKSATLLTFFNTHFPESLPILLNPEAPGTKQASSDDHFDEFLFLSSEDGNYYLNDQPITAKVACDVLDGLGADNDTRCRLLSGGYIYADNREKVAAIVTPKVEVVVRTDEGNQAQPANHDDEYSPISVATVMKATGEEVRGILVEINTYIESPQRRYGCGKSFKRLLFIGDDFHTVQDNVMVLDSVKVMTKDVKEASPSSTPMIGMFGVAISNYDVAGPFEISMVKTYGTKTIIRCIPSNNMGAEEFTIDDDRKFYEIPRAIVGLKKICDNELLSASGYTVTVKRGLDGKMIFENKELSRTNMIYALMSKHAMSNKDAVHVVQQAWDNGVYSVKVAKEDDKKDDAKKKEEEKTEPEKQAPPTEQVAPPTQPAQPITSGELEDVAAVNEPTTMDSYLAGRLTDVNDSSHEDILRASDSILDSMKNLGKLLYLSRVNGVSTFEEKDAQIALSKLTEVLNGLGVSAAQVTTQPNSDSDFGYPGGVSIQNNASMSPTEPTPTEIKGTFQTAY